MFHPLARTAAVLFALGAAAPAFAQQTDEEKIRDALAAAPPQVSTGATVLDWPAEAGADFRVLRQGDNGWTCLADLPGDGNFEPMCNDAAWMEWIRAFAAGEEPAVDRVGVSYMFNSRWATSNLDPTATEETPDNMWVEGGAHIMIIVPDPEMLGQYPSEPGPGAYVMWGGTPYAHLMVPLEEMLPHGGH